MPEMPYAELLYANGEVVGVRCPVCRKELPTTNPLEAGRLYGAHFNQEHRDADE